MACLERGGPFCNVGKALLLDIVAVDAVDSYVVEPKLRAVVAEYREVRNLVPGDFPAVIFLEGVRKVFGLEREALPFGFRRPFVRGLVVLVGLEGFQDDFVVAVAAFAIILIAPLIG